MTHTVPKPIALPEVTQRVLLSRRESRSQSDVSKDEAGQPLTGNLYRARRHWFHMGEIMAPGAWLAVVTFENGNESIRPCATRGEARAYARMQHAYGDVKTAVRRARRSSI